MSDQREEEGILERASELGHRIGVHDAAEIIQAYEVETRISYGNVGYAKGNGDDEGDSHQGQDIHDSRQQEQRAKPSRPVFEAATPDLYRGSDCCDFLHTSVSLSGWSGGR